MRLPARDHYISRESVTRIYFGERDQAAVLRLSQHRSLARCRSCEVIPPMIGRLRRLTVAFGYFASLHAHAAVCVGVEKAAVRRAEVTKRTCVVTQGLLRGQLPNCGAHSRFYDRLSAVSSCIAWSRESALCAMRRDRPFLSPFAILD